MATEPDSYFYFFTDDNFARNAQWERIFDTLIELREKEQIDVKFMMQVDVLCYKIKNFVDKARRAGCTKVFIGMESINPESLKDAAKTQNKAEDYVNLISAWRKAEVSTHVGYIFGFPHDSEESLDATWIVSSTKFKSSKPLFLRFSLHCLARGIIWR